MSNHIPEPVNPNSRYRFSNLTAPLVKLFLNNSGTIILAASKICEPKL